MNRWINRVKSAAVKAARGASPEEIAEEGEILDVIAHPNDESQYYEVYWYENYVWVVVIGRNPDRFITAYKSSKFKRKYRP